jgi:hypothetical protein
VIDDRCGNPVTRVGPCARLGADVQPFPAQGAAAPAPGLPQPFGPCQEPGWRSDLCAAIAAAMANRTFLDMADAVTFALLYQHYRTRQAIAPSVAAGVIEPLRGAWDPVRGQAGLSTYRVSGFLGFWVFSSYAGVDWPRFPDGLDTPEEFLSLWQTYGIVQFTARQTAINHRRNGHRGVGGRVAKRHGGVEGLRPAADHLPAVLGRHRGRPPHARGRPDRRP